MSDATAQQPTTELPRASRQNLVMPPRQANWPVVVGAVASGLVGFGLVFGLGIGRSHHPAHDHHQAGRPAVAAFDSAGALQARFPEEAEGGETDLPVSREDPAAAAAEPTAFGNRPLPEPDFRAAEFSAPPSRFGRPASEPGDRYAARMVSHEADPDTGEPPLRSSRFAPPDLPPPDLPPAPLLDPTADQAAPADTESSLSEAGADIEAAPVAAPGVADPSDAELEAEPETDDPGELPSAPVGSELPVVATDPLPEPFAAPSAAPVSPAIDSLPDPPARDEPAPWTNPSAVAPVAATEADHSTAPPATPAALPFAAAPPLTAAAPPVAASPFATAPPLAAPSDGGIGGATGPGAFADQESSAAAAGLTGQGVPGPLQLEGIQTPQLAVEKRGPKEIQVGKPARYEILVRNVGSATAHDILLRDAVPRGTSLIATTPPAAPASEQAASAGDLVWMLGTLPPGGETRVLMELMPEEEGEIGSVASVSFRADATLRSRSTKPALAIDCPEPDPVRIGRDMQVSLTISNPGSGTATGVVLEAFLPETVSHRAGSELEFDVGQLRPGETKTIDLVLGTRGPGLQPARLVARADAGIEELLQVPLEVTAPTLELAIDMPARRFLQRPATCRIAMVNSGTASARAVELAVQLPPGMKFVRANNAGWHDERTHRVLWNLEELPAGETGTVEAVVMPVQPGPQRITAAARSTDGPSAQVDHLCQVEGLAALSFQVMDSEDPIEVAGLTEYVIRVSNDGTKAASGVRVAAMLLGDLEPVEATGPGGHRVENLAVEFEPLAKLGPGEEAVYRVQARGHRAGDQRVQVQLVSDDHPTPITKEEITSVYDDR